MTGVQPDQLAVAEDLAKTPFGRLDWRNTDAATLRRLARHAVRSLQGDAKDAEGVRYKRSDTGQPGFALHVYRPARPSGAVYFVHGGGWMLYDAELYASLCRQIAMCARTTVYIADYRKAPEHRFRAGLDDVWRGFLAVTKAETGIVVAGDSAGANLAFAVAQLAQMHSTRPIAGLCAWYGVFDPYQSGISHDRYRDGFGMTTDRLEMLWSNYRASHVDLANPLYNTLLSIFDRPFPVRLCGAEFDPCRSDSEKLEKRLASQEFVPEMAIIEGTLHGCLLYAHRIAAADREIQNASVWIRARLAEMEQSI